MKPDKILFIDTETGGIDPSIDSLLSIGLVVWKESRIIGEKEILVNDGVLHVTDQALAINGIDLEEHKKAAVSPGQAIQAFDEFLAQYFEAGEKVTLGGHNINFDVNFLKTFLTKNNYSFQQRFSHRHVDTASVLFYLYLTGKLKQKIVSSQDAFDFFGITVTGRHTALGDAVATATLFTKLVSILYRDGKTRTASKDTMPELF